MLLEGSCLCEAVEFSLESETPYPFMRCYCSICRKANGGGGYAINIRGLYPSLSVEGKERIRRYRVPAERTAEGGDGLSNTQRAFCGECGAGLWAYNPEWEPGIYPFASAVDTPLPEPPEIVHIFVASRPSWVDLPEGENHRIFEEYPEESVREWHENRDLLVE